VAADTLCYFGVLAEPLEAAHATLTLHGVLIITLESLVSKDVAFNLEPHGRYTHSESYVRRELTRAGFEIKSLAQHSVRREGERDVPGLLVVAQSA
jgi:predicted TPR repeat methyltransferase